MSVVPDENEPAYVFAGGPFSDRNPFPDPATGTPSTRFPANDFVQFIPLTRLQLLSWRVQLLGQRRRAGQLISTLAVLRPMIGLRDRYRAGIADDRGEEPADVQARFRRADGQRSRTRSSNAADAGLRRPDHRPHDRGHVLRARVRRQPDRIGWQLIGYDGDSQPLGYTIFDETTMTYRERADKPNSTAEPRRGLQRRRRDHAAVSDACWSRVVGGPHFP